MNAKKTKYTLVPCHKTAVQNQNRSREHRRLNKKFLEELIAYFPLT
jgi:hypothetical protein